MLKDLLDDAKIGIYLNENYGVWTEDFSIRHEDYFTDKNYWYFDK